MANNGYRVGAFAVIALVLLRIAIGFQFLGAGVEKLDPSFSAAGFLRGSNGPMADFYKSMAPLPHDWDNLSAEKWPDSFKFDHERRYYEASKKEVANRPTRTDKIGFIPYPTEAYGPYLARVADDWKKTSEQFKSLPGMSDEQQATIDETFERHYRSLSYFAEKMQGDFAEWQHELDRLAELTDSDEAQGVPFMEGRIADKESEATGLGRPLLAGVNSEETLYLHDLKSVLTDEQLQSATLAQRVEAIVDPPKQLDKVNKAVTWFTLGVGVLLILGLFTRITSIAAAGFLVSVMMTQPIWAEGLPTMAKLIFPYQGIEVLALLVMAGLGAGSWAGMDGCLFRQKD